ncbi:MAG: Ku protein [Vicinamibacterales bacterium]
MARPIWKGAITFGLVSIPIQVHTAVRDKQLRFHLLTATDHVRVKFERVSEKTHKPVAWNDLVKGYEYSKGRYVVLTAEDFDAAALEKTRTIDILDFVQAEAVDDRFFDKPYYVTPGAGGERAYVLLRETIREAGKIGIAKFVLRDRQHLAAIEVIEDALVLSTLRFADELVPASEHSFPSGKGQRAADLRVAKMLVNELSAEWNPEKYTDDYRTNLVRIIEARKKGKEAALEPEETDRSGHVVDLMERLRASLEGGKAGKGGKRAVSKSASAPASRPKRTRKAAAKPGRRRRAA